jgi:uncharacterized membrane protein HdeD (DUF308 family)
MKPLISFFAKLYPERWRLRYAAEFEALLDDAGPTARTAFNVLAGALSMRLRTCKAWWFLACCGVLQAAYSAIYFFMLRPDGSLALRTATDRGTLVELGRMSLAAGVFTIAAAICDSRKSKSWLLLLNGLASITLGLIFPFLRRPVAFHTIALSIVAMAITIGTYEFAAARALHRHLVSEWLLGAAGAFSVGFALVFLAFVLGWMNLNPRSPHQSLHLLGSYYAFTAICLFTLAANQFLHPNPDAALTTRGLSS